MPRVSASERAITRAALVEAAKTEFAERGLAGARFDEISVSAGRAKGTIYNYFATKEDLFFSVVAEWCELLSSSYDPSGAATPRQRLLEIVRIDTEIARKDPDLARVVVQHTQALGVSHREAVAEAVAPAVDLLTDVIGAGIAVGELVSDVAPATLARLFLGVVSAFELEALAGSGDLTLDDVVELVDRHFIAGLQPVEQGA